MAGGDGGDDGSCGDGAMGFQEDCLVEMGEERSFQFGHGAGSVIVPCLKALPEEILSKQARQEPV